MTTAFLSHPACKLHDMSAGHPECPARLDVVETLLSASGILDRLHHVQAPSASRVDLERVHTADYVQSIFEAAPSQPAMVQLDQDTAMNEHSLEAALKAAGAQIKAVDLVMGEDTANAYCHVRPPGHHAVHHRAMGFCFFNNVAVGAAYALDRYKLNRVAILDFDVHHGNGTEDMFAGNNNVLFCSSFQHPHYPYTGVHPSAENVVYAPLSAGSAGAAFQAAVQTHWLPAVDAFKPEMLFISAGFDAHHEDPLSGLSLQENDYYWVTEQIMSIAATHAHGRIVSTLEGGYALEALASSVKAHILALMA